tara:strand:- start:326 stop:799 length:474 start_codon:yes stop_codon:yes gene_type:complete
MKEIHENILTEKERRSLLKFVKTKLEIETDRHPGTQTYNKLHEFEELNIFLKKIKKYYAPYKVSSCWAVCTMSNSLLWHNHVGKSKIKPSRWSFVYYLQNKHGVGTMFKDPSIKAYDLIEYSNGKQNSLLKFASSIVHSSPVSHKKFERYIISLDVK